MSSDPCPAYLARIEAEVLPKIEAAGFEVYETKVFFSAKRYTVRMLIDRREGGIMLDECADISRMVDSVIEEKAIIAENYLIEVSSPGLDRELKTAKDFIRIKGKRVQVWLTEPVQDKKSFSGDLKDVDIAKGVCTLATKSGDVEIPFAVLHMGKQEFNF